MTTSLATWLESFLQGDSSSTSFSAKYPYYAAILSRLCPVEDPSIGAMAVSLHGRVFYLHVNTAYFVKHPEYLQGVLLHEVHHIVLGHLAHPKYFGIEHPDLMEIVQEISANEFIEELLPEPITWRLFEGYGMRPGESTLDRYLRLARFREGSRDGNHVHDNGPKRGTLRVPLDKGAIETRLARVVDRHLASPRTIQEPPPGALHQTRAIVEQLDARPLGDSTANSPTRPLLAGREPGQLIEDLLQNEGPPARLIDYRAALAGFIGEKRSPQRSFHRPSRRFPDRLFEVPGRTWSGRTLDRPHLLVGVDTSMSMREHELREVSKQLQLLCAVARLTIAEHDVEITRIYRFSGAITQVVGRGGTDLRPLFSAELLRAHKVQGVVSFTDGQGPFPNVPPLIPVLWILSKDSPFDCPWGRRAALM